MLTELKGCCMELLIKNARIIDVTQDFIGDIYIKNGLIKEIGKEINKDNIEILRLQRIRF